MEKTLIYNLTYQELCEVIASWEQSKFRVDQIWKGLYQQFYKSVDDFSTLPAQLRDRIQDSFLLSGLTPVNKIQSEDTQTEKTLFRL
ncbi:23S rRNA (adenine(2503)-C2)-methyltransferase, partial [bacterium]